MSSVAEEQVACERCRRPGTFRMWRSMNVTLDPSLREQLLRRTIFRYRCAGCGHEQEILYPFLYHDMARQLMFWLLPVDESGRPVVHQLPETRSPGYRLRAMGDINSVIEAIFVAEAGLDDVALQMVKVTVQSMLPADERGELLFEERAPRNGEDCICFALVVDGRMSGLAAPARMYEKMLAHYEGLGGASWLGPGYKVVDDELAMRALAAR